MVALFVILTIVVCVSIDGVIQFRKAKKERASRRSLTTSVPVSTLTDLSAPANLFSTVVTPGSKSTFGRGHDWRGCLCPKLIGRIDDIVLPEVGKEISRGDVLFAVKQDNHRAAFASPIDGTVTMVDKELQWHPEMIESDPYKEGWVCSIKPRNLAQNLRRLFAADEATRWLKSEAQRFQEFFAAQTIDNLQMGQVLPDGGELAGGVLEFADAATWDSTNHFFGLRRSTLK